MEKRGDEMTDAGESSSFKRNESCDEMKSQEIRVATNKGKSVINIASSSTTNHDSDASRVMIEELALKKQINSHLPVVGGSNEEIHARVQEPIMNSSSRTNNLSLERVAAASPAMSNDGINLREWLISEQQKINKAERLKIFRQIVMMVELAHSRGLAFQDLRPSYFKLFPANEVKYVGSLVQTNCLESVIFQDTVNSEDQLSRKRFLEQELHSNKNQKRNENMFSRQNGTWNKSGSPVADDIGRQQSTSLNFQLEEKWWFQLEEKWWYASPEELFLKESRSSNIYSLGVLLFELFCCFESWEVHVTAMTNLRRRILPPKFLSENSKEAAFCLWLLHPQPPLRPSARDVRRSDCISESLEWSVKKQLQSSLDEEEIESKQLLDFFTSLNEQREKHAAKLIEEIAYMKENVAEVEKRHLLKGNEFLSTTHERSSYVIESGYGSKNTNSHETRSLRNKKAYFSMRSQIQLPDIDSATRSDQDFLKRENGDMKHKVTDRLRSLFGGLCKYSLYNKFEFRTTVRNSDITSVSNVISSLSFDQDEDFFAAAGVSNKIKIFEFNALLRNSVDIHYPVVQMTNKFKVTSVTWNNYFKNYLVSTDYDGLVQLWDVNTGQGFSRFLEHRETARSVHFSPIDPTKFASGSNDRSVKLWSINEKKAVSSVKHFAGPCYSVQFSPQSTHLLAIGCDDSKTYCFDLRNTSHPWCAFGGRGFKKAVIHVRFVDPETLVTASTDNTLRLWDLNKTSNDPRQVSKNKTLTLAGHANKKYFVGLSVSNGYITCGSETNEVFAYYKSFPMPITSHSFGSVNPLTGQDTGDNKGQFVSSVTWRRKSNMVVAGNSTGSIKILHLV